MLLQNTKLIRMGEPYLANYSIGKRDIYYKFFRPDVIPNFTFTFVTSLKYFET